MRSVTVTSDPAATRALAFYVTRTMRRTLLATAAGLLVVGAAARIQTYRWDPTWGVADAVYVASVIVLVATLVVYAWWHPRRLTRALHARGPDEVTVAWDEHGYVLDAPSLHQAVSWSDVHRLDVRDAGVYIVLGKDRLLRAAALLPAVAADAAQRADFVACAEAAGVQTSKQPSQKRL